MLSEKKTSSLLKKMKDSALSFFSFQQKDTENDTTSIDIMIGQKEKYHHQPTLFDHVYQKSDITTDW